MDAIHGIRKSKYNAILLFIRVKLPCIIVCLKILPLIIVVIYDELCEFCQMPKPNHAIMTYLILIQSYRHSNLEI